MAAALQAVKEFRIRALTPVLNGASKLPADARPKVLNPFLPHKSPESGRWHPPQYSLRRQAELIKHARANGVLHLLPPGPKLSARELPSAPVSTPSVPAAEGPPPSSEVAETSASASVASETDAWWMGPVEWEGTLKEEVKGADVGNRLYAGKKRMFKGHKWERTQEKRTWERKSLMKDMAARVERFQTTYRRKTPNPTSAARPVSYSKLPF